MLFRKIILYSVAIFFVIIIGLFGIAHWKRDEILQKITAHLNEGLRGEVHIGGINFTFLHRFPRFTLSLTNVVVRGEEFEVYQRDFVKAEKILLDVGLFQLLRNNISIQRVSIQNADIAIFKAADGYTNLTIFQHDTAVEHEARHKTAALFTIKDAFFKNVRFSFTDSVKIKSYQFRFDDTHQRLAMGDSLMSLRIQGKMHFDGLLFNATKGAFLPNNDVVADINLTFAPTKHELIFLPSTLTVNQSTVGIQGKLVLQPGAPFHLRFNADQLVVEEGKKLLNFHLANQLDKFKVKDPIQIAVNVEGHSVPGEKAKVDVTFSCDQKTTVSVKELTFSDFTFAGNFINHVREDAIFDGANSRVTIHKFKGRYGYLPVEGRLMMEDFKDPFIDLAVSTAMPLKDLNPLADERHIVFRGGNVKTNIAYKGRLREYLNPGNKAIRGQLKGSTQIKNGNLVYLPKRLQITGMDGFFEFNNSGVEVKEFHFAVNENPVHIQGDVKNLIPFFLVPDRKAKVTLKLNSSLFKLDQVLVLNKQPREKHDYKSDRHLSLLVENLIDKLDLDLGLTIDNLQYRQFHAKGVGGKLALNYESLFAQNLHMDMAGGTVSGDLSIEDFNNVNRPFKVEIKVDQADIEQFFENFSNFNQDAIVAGNLRGKISADVVFNGVLDEELKVMAPTMEGNITSTIGEGRLINFEPLQNISIFLFKKRNFNDISFAEIKSNFNLKGDVLHISRMEVQSSVLSFFVQGKYSFSDTTHLSIQLPLSNLKKHDKDYRPENIGTDAKAGMSVYLHVYRDKKGKIAVAYDPFKKWAKATAVGN